MALYSTEALIIGVRNWGEADKIITFLSPEKGCIAAVAYGCRRPKNALAGSLQLFNQVEVQLSEGERLDTVRTCSLLRTYRVLSTDFTAMAYAAFVAETASRLAIENFPQQEMYQRLLEIFAAFGERNPRVTALAAAYQLLEFSGMQLSYEYCAECNKEITADSFFSYELGGALCPECGRERLREMGEPRVFAYSPATKGFIVQLLQLNWQEKPALSVSGRTLMAAEALLLGYLYFILEKPLKSLEFIRQLT